MQVRRDGGAKASWGWNRDRRALAAGAWLIARIGAGVAPCAATEPWTVAVVGPSGADSQAFGCEGTTQVGYVLVPQSAGGAQYHAALWTGGAPGYVDLHVAGAASSEAFGISGMSDGSGGVQVGGVAVAGAYHASLWRGTPESWVDMNPAGATGSIALCSSGLDQVGYSIFGSSDHAGLWRGTAESWVDLHPDATVGATHSHAVACDGPQQVGYLTFGSWRATMWMGTPESRVDLHPAGATRSECAGVAGGVQVGNATVGGVRRASLWRGSAQSWTDLHPGNAGALVATESGALAAAGSAGEWQVGYAVFAGVARACLWHGSAGTWEDLSVALGPLWGASYARGAWTDGRTVVVSGSATNLLTGREVAVVWRRAACCAADFDCSGGPTPLTVADIFEFLNAWFGNDPRADFDHSGTVGLEDVFGFLGAWFAGC